MDLCLDPPQPGPALAGLRCKYPARTVCGLAGLGTGLERDSRGIRSKRTRMKTKQFYIERIPAVLYGEPAQQGYLFLHGQMGRKEEAEAFAQAACPRGYQVLSIDLPAHGERLEKGEELLPWDGRAGHPSGVGLGGNTGGAQFPSGPTALGLTLPCWLLPHRSAPCWPLPF